MDPVGGARLVEDRVNGAGVASQGSELQWSFVVSTIGRPDELRRLLESLAEQDEASLEVIVVEQNDDRVSERLLLEEAWPFATTYLHMKERGLSKGRNLGLEHVRGNVVAFPDDNCWYEATALRRVREIFESKPGLSGVSIRQVDSAGGDSLGRWHDGSGAITRWNLMHRVTSSSLFLRRELIERVGGFDEDLGLGASTPWQAGEENDYVCRAVSSGARIHYEPLRLVLQDDWRRDAVAPVDKVYRYNAGFARSLKVNRYPWWFFAYYVLRQAAAYGKAVVSMDGRARGMARAAVRGRIDGWRATTAEAPGPETTSDNPFDPLDAVRRLHPRRRYVDYIHLSDLLAALRAHAREVGGDILDYGSGTAPYKSLFDGAVKYRAADFEVNSFADVVLSPEGAVPLGDESVDAILSIQVLEHVAEPDVYLRECRRLLRSEGTLLLTTHGMWEFHPVPQDFQRWTHQGLSELLESEGFHPVEVTAVSDGSRGALQMLQLSMEHKKLPYVVRGMVRVVLNAVADLRLLEKERMRPASESRMPIAYLVIARKTGA